MKARLWKPLLCAIVPLITAGHPSAFPGKAPPDPFHDVFYTYYTESRPQARRMLSSLLGNHVHRGRALINSGKIEEIEKRPERAAALYRDAFNRGERMALPYLYRSLQKSDPAAAGKLLDSLSTKEPGGWLAYERSLLMLRRGDSAGALRLLGAAVSLGFNSRDLLLREPLFDPLRTTPEYRDIIMRMKPPPTGRLTRMLDDIRRERLKGTPLHIDPAFSIIGELERKGRLAEAEHALTRLLAAPLAFNERSLALYRMARIRARRGDTSGAREALARHEELFKNTRDEASGYRAIIAPFISDTIANDDAGLLPYAKP